MADDPKPKPSDGDEHNSFKDSGVGIGQTSSGELDTFPLSELPQRQAERNAEEKAWDDIFGAGPQTDDDLRKSYEENAGAVPDEGED